jgi:hypothetical protein
VKLNVCIESLSADDQAIARSIFLALVQLNEDSGDTRRRAAVSELIATDAMKPAFGQSLIGLRT